MIKYEAAVAGGIPVIKALGEGLAGNEITRVMGVMNGTCNYILTQHGGRRAKALTPLYSPKPTGLAISRRTHTSTWAALMRRHKLALLSSLAFGTQVNFAGIELEGIQRVSIEDITRRSRHGL